jgi:hypothetical protein
MNGNGQPLTCTHCGGAVEVVEDVEGTLDWGPCVIGADGVVRPVSAGLPMKVVMADNSTPVGRPRALCMDDDCGHQWRLRRRFETTPEARRKGEDR